MKKFLSKIFHFVSLPLTFFLGLTLFFLYISNNLNYKLNNNVENLFIGDSHIQCAIEDKLLENAQNISVPAECFYFSYYKLSKALETNHSIKNVYLGASYHSISYYYDDYLIGKYSSSVGPRYFYLLPNKEKFKIIFWNFHKLPDFVKNITLMSYEYLSNNLLYTFGGYHNEFKLTKAKKTSMDKRLHLQFNLTNKNGNFSEINILYLEKIIRLCKKKKIKLVLLNVPVHKYYKCKIPHDYIHKFQDLIKRNNVKCLDFDYLKLQDICFIPDGDHLSAEGAVKFTYEIKKILK